MLMVKWIRDSVQNGELVFPYENVGRQKMHERRKMRAAQK